MQRSRVHLALVLLLATAACRGGDGASEGDASGYLAPPVVAEARLEGGQAQLAGEAAPRAEVRLASPTGEALQVKADAEGRWRIVLPPAGRPRIFGLSMRVGERRTQAPGYVVVAPNGQAALLRAGVGAQRLDQPSRLRIGAVDFDGQGATVLSGRAPPNALLAVRVDGRHATDGRADEEGRYSIALPTPAGRRRFEVVSDGVAQTLEVDLARAPPLAEGPLRSQFSPSGLQLDWLTPGGGVQSTILPG
ncbi:hypothetical protein [Phenylobacterium deserti]|uniref:Carboxypeptidase regulatory-like domain-containing protein n=1 Tax=Phenylobacterium deserti TaxID=1914756 RepID=A0A328ACU9_9CAUL|nr:hypothetical protein [Phenylobacterium deserti]RAK52327.1 hypothetical protein DJ018_14445 [Phenylobacterium deserti]